MNLFKTLSQSKWKMQMLLFVFTFAIYFFYFHPIFFHLNTILSSLVDDSLKNYYTYVFHIKNDSSNLHFNGFNFPFGEHAVYTDCQPLLCFLIRSFPFAQEYSIGILHFLIFFSFLITPLFLYEIFTRLGLPTWYSFFISIGITLLNPQFYRIYAGHYALAYSCIIPASTLLLLSYFQHPSKLKFYLIFIFNTFIFFIHPYYGLGLSLFTLFSVLSHQLMQKRNKIDVISFPLILGLLPIVLFKLFMAVTDHHVGRSEDPFGNKDFISDHTSFLVPVFGPFSKFLEKTFGSIPQHFEGYSYIGIALVVILIPFMLLSPLLIRKWKLNPPILALLISSLILLLFSFGIQFKIQELFHVKIAALNQFRAMGRFSWFMYYTLPLFLFPFLYFTLKEIVQVRTLSSIFFSITFLFFSLNLVEADAYFKIYDGIIWNDRNIFNADQLTVKEKEVILRINQKKTQAIIPLPLFYIGSEVYDRVGYTNSMLLSSIYSYHCNLPILSSSMSRTSVSETEEGINLLNAYKKNKKAEEFLNNKDFFVLYTGEELLEDEKRILNRTSFFTRDDSTQFGFISKKQLLTPHFDPLIVELKNKISLEPDSLRLIYIKDAPRKPFLPANQLSYEMVYVLDSNRIQNGDYFVSLHYHPGKKTYREMAQSFIVTKAQGKEYIWQDVFPLKVYSGFYSTFCVIERPVHLEKNSKYEFMITGGYDLNYQVSDFLLRPKNITVRLISGNDTSYNNFPQHDVLFEKNNVK